MPNKIERVAVVMSTYFPDSELGQRRVRYAKTAWSSLLNGLRSPVPLHLVLADDGSAPTHLDALEGMVKHGAIHNPEQWGDAHLVSGPNAGIGASLNRALDKLEELWGLEGWAWIYTADDWVLVNEDGLDLTLPLWLADEGYDLVRLDLAHPGLKATTVFRQGRGWWLHLDLDRGGYGFSTRPALFTPHLRLVAGRFDEGLNSYEVERLYAERVAAKGGQLSGAIVAGSLNTTWENLAYDDMSIGEREPDSGR